MRFGVHVSLAKRLADTPQQGKQIGCKAMQIFCGNPRGWKKGPLDLENARAFRDAARQCDLAPTVVHATYLINLAAPDDDIYAKSVEAFLEELARSSALGAEFYVVHSGSHKGMGEDLGRQRIRAALRRAHEEVEDRPTILLENTAGTKNSLGATFEDLAILLDGANLPRTGICFDTCHALAAGYEIRTARGVAETLDLLEKTLGMDRLKVLHINDSKGDLGSRLDRHEHIGQGCIGSSGFKAFFSDRRLWDLPAILETPQDTPEDNQRNLWAAMEIATQAGAVPADALASMPTAALEPVAGSQSKPGGKKKAKKRTLRRVAKKKIGQAATTSGSGTKIRKAKKKKAFGSKPRKASAASRLKKKQDRRGQGKS